MRTYDAVIVGAGSAGCVLAARLSEDPARSVLLIEAGPDHLVAEELPATLTTQGWNPQLHPEFGWRYTGYRMPSQAGTVQVFRGRTTGGSSAVNSGMFLRNVPEDFASWGSDLWSFDAVLPFFRQLEADQDFPGGAHGIDGPIPVGRGSRGECSPFQHAFYEAALKHGVAEKPDLNAPEGSGVGLVPRNDAAGLRVSTSMAYLGPARQRANLTVLAGALVHRIGFKGRRVSHVDVSVGDRFHSIGAHEVVLCAGAIETPHILMLSGLGPAPELTKLGIEVTEDLPGVGKNLGDHPVAILEYEPGEFGASDEDRPGAAPPRCGIVHTAAGSPMRNDLLILPVDAAHFRTPPSFGTDAGPARPPAGPDARVRVHCMLQLPLSRGWLQLPSSCPTDAPILHFNYFSDPLDLSRLREGVRMAVEIMEQPMSDGVVGARVTPTGIDLASDRSLDEWLLRTFNTCYHSCGTARMGAEDDPSAVVDEQARVRGVEGLRVADLSIAPHVSRGTTNPTAVMIGERVAKLMASLSS